MGAVIELITVMSRREASRLLGVSRASQYRRLKGPMVGPLPKSSHDAILPL